MTTHQPPGTFHPPTGDAVAADTRRRVKALEQRPQPGLEDRTFTATATLPSPLTFGDGVRTTGRWWPWRGAIRLEMVIIDAIDVESVSTIIVQRGGDPVLTFEVSTDGVTRAGQDLTWKVNESLDLTAQGDIGTLMVQLEFRGPGNAAFVFSIPGGDEG